MHALTSINTRTYKIQHIRTHMHLNTRTPCTRACICSCSVYFSASYTNRHAHLSNEANTHMTYSHAHIRTRTHIRIYIYIFIQTHTHTQMPYFDERSTTKDWSSARGRNGVLIGAIERQIEYDSTSNESASTCTYNKSALKKAKDSHSSHEREKKGGVCPIKRCFSMYTTKKEF